MDNVVIINAQRVARELEDEIAFARQRPARRLDELDAHA